MQITTSLRAAALVAALLTIPACKPDKDGEEQGGTPAESTQPDSTQSESTEAPTTQPATTTRKTGKLLDESKWQHHLKGVESGDVLAVETVLSDPDQYAGKTVTVKGPIESVCQKAGCWLRVGEGDRTLMVKFDPYSKERNLIDAEGEILLQGKVVVEKTSVEELRHYKKDEGASEEEIAKITEPRVEAKLEATGYARPKGE